MLHLSWKMLLNWTVFSLVRFWMHNHPSIAEASPLEPVRGLSSATWWDMLAVAESWKLETQRLTFWLADGQSSFDLLKKECCFPSCCSFMICVFSSGDDGESWGGSETAEHHQRSPAFLLRGRRTRRRNDRVGQAPGLLTPPPSWWLPNDRTSGARTGKMIRGRPTRDPGRMVQASPVSLDDSMDRMHLPQWNPVLSLVGHSSCRCVQVLGQVLEQRNICPSGAEGQILHESDITDVQVKEILISMIKKMKHWTDQFMLTYWTCRTFAIPQQSLPWDPGKSSVETL